MLETHELVAGYQRDILILQGITMQASAREITAVIGANGVGKSTLLKTVFGFLRPVSGSVLLDGREITHVAPNDMARAGVAYVPQAHSTFPHMSVWENLELGCWSFRRDRQRVHERMEQVLARFPQIRERLRFQAGNLSGGLQRTLELGRALLTQPRVLLLDEPTVGVAPAAVRSIYSDLKRLARDEGLTILLVDQNVRMALGVADRVYEIEMGKVKRVSSGEVARGRVDTLAREWLV